MEYQIGDFSKISRLSIKTLRYYHECGMLVPSRIDEVTGYRYYDEKLVEKTSIIAILKDLDFSLKEITNILNNYSDDSEIIEFIRNKKEEISKKIKDYKIIKSKLESILTLQKGNIMVKQVNNIVIKDIPDFLGATYSFNGKYTETGKAFSIISKSYGIMIAGKPFRIDHDNSYKETTLIEAGFPVKTDKHIKEIDVRMIKGGKAVTLIHKGSYDFIGNSYKKILDFINQSGIKIIEKPREVYIKGPGMILKGNPGNYLTELQYFVNYQY